MKQAVIRTGGKQYLVKKGEEITVEKLNKKEGASVDFKDVLLIADEKSVKVGNPKVKGVKVSGKITKQLKAPKVTVIKYKPKTRYRRKQGHRQQLTKVKIEKIGA